MHLIVAHARAWPGLRCGALALPALEEILQRWSIVESVEAPDAGRHVAHELVWARAMGLDTTGATLPYAHALAPRDGVALDDAPWGLVSPVHAHVSLDHVSLSHPKTLGLDEGDARAIFETLQPWFEGDGHRLRWGSALRWYASHPHFATLLTTSIDRVAGHPIEAWQAQGPHASAWHRLQNECQMLLHEHPVNDARDARREAAVNSIWLSGNGALPAAAGADVKIDERLGGLAWSAPGGEGAEALWQALDREAAALLRPADGTVQRLSLCSNQRAVTLAPGAGSWWQRLRARRAANLDAVLAALSKENA